MNELIMLIAVSAVVFYWYSGLKARECAMNAARHCCTRAKVQLLDQTVQVTRQRFARSPSGQLAIARRYGFEYCTDGDSRYQGSVEIIANRSGAVWLQNCDPDTGLQSGPATGNETTPSSAQIIPLKPRGQDS
ncbi:DUF3301 domain-containing protein [Aestuariirhabdus sp. LZHN29]|uniref:DUF3301 domain-containing protein n=1 Tax=Aestuariirhabdus sp. LZHN29 TaxID=3417462 RepID=UPI003CED2786